MPMFFRLATMAGDPARPNEDYAGALGDSAILIDGSGAPGDLPTGCIHGVPWFTRQLGARCLAVMAAGDDSEPLGGVLGDAIQQVADLHRDTCDLSVPGTPSGVVIMTRARGASLDYLVLGDSTLVIDEDGYIRTVSDRRMESVAVEEFRAMLALPTGTPEKQAARMTYVRRQQPLRNHPDGYPVASTDPGAANKALTGSVPLGNVRRAALISDGVSRFTEFGVGTWDEMLGILAGSGPGDLFRRIREAEDTDPDGKQWPRAKRHDDVGAVFWETAS
jgi:hypothetical protein